MQRLALILVAAFGLCALVITPASAQRGVRQAESEVDRLVADARSAYDNLELDAAEAALDRAISIGERYRLQSKGIVDAYMQRGILFHVRDKDANRATDDFIQALTIDPRAKLDPLVSTPSLERLFEDARRQAGRRAPPRRDDPPPRGYDEPPQRDPTPAPARGGQDLYHEPPAKAANGQSLPLTVEVDDRINRVVFRVYLYFKSARSRQMQKVEMQPKGDSAFTARIGQRFMVGTMMSYYIVAEDRQRRPVATVGSAQRPMLIPIDGDDMLGGVDEFASGSSLDGGSGGGGAHKLVTIGVSVGTGAGYITDKAEPQNQPAFKVSPGFALTPFHTMLEVDFWVTPWLGLGAYARIQIIEFAHLEGGRVKFQLFKSGSSSMDARLGGGFGRVRHLVDLGELLDTTLQGPYHWTTGVTYRYSFNDMVGLIISPDFLHLIGTSPAYQIDLNIGAEFAF